MDVAATGLIRTRLTYPATVLVPPLAVWISVVLYVSCCVVAGFVGSDLNGRVVCVLYFL